MTGLVFYGEKRHDQVDFRGGRRLPVTFASLAVPVILAARSQRTRFGLAGLDRPIGHRVAIEATGRAVPGSTRVHSSARVTDNHHRQPSSDRSTSSSQGR